MPTTRLPLGASPSYYGGIRTVVPFGLALMVIIPMGILIGGVVGAHEKWTSALFLAGLALSAMTYGAFLPVLRRGFKGTLKATDCRRYSRILACLALICAAFSVLLAVTTDRPSRALAMVAIGLLCYAGAYHLQRIYRVLETATPEAAQSDG
jgi:hypothetical protein